MTEHKTETYFKMLREMRDVVFSTVAEDGTPRARIIDVMLAEGGDKGTVLLTTFGTKVVRRTVPLSHFWYNKNSGFNPGLSPACGCFC